MPPKPNAKKPNLRQLQLRLVTRRQKRVFEAPPESKGAFMLREGRKVEGAKRIGRLHLRMGDQVIYEDRRNPKKKGRRATDNKKK